MTFAWSLFGGLISVGWLMCIPRLLLVPVLVSFLIFCSLEPATGLLLMLLLQVFSFVQASVGTRKANHGVVQKRFMMVLFGGMVALFGQALKGGALGSVLGIVGLLLMIPNGVSSFFLSRFYERLTLRAFMGAVLIPAFVALELLFKLKSGMPQDLSEVWRAAMLGTGVVTILSSGLMALLRLRFKSVVIFGSQVWIGISLLILASESSDRTELALAAVSIATLSSAVLLGHARQLGSKHYDFARLAALALPGTAGFAALHSCMGILMNMGVIWVCIAFLGFMLQVAALVLCKPQSPHLSNGRVRTGFWVAVVVQVAVGLGYFWVGTGGMK